MVGSLRLRRDFIRALLSGDARAAERVVRDAVAAGYTNEQIDVELITPALFMVGDKWATGEISVAEEHLASEIVLRVLALQREAGRAARRRLETRVLLLAPEGERHVIGLQMAADLLIGAGYDIRMLGADVPIEEIGPAAARYGVDVVCFTATLADTAERVDAAIDHLRAVRPELGFVLGGAAVTFELAAGWGASVCPDVSTTVSCVDALVQHAPQNRRERSRPSRAAPAGSGARPGAADCCCRRGARTAPRRRRGRARTGPARPRSVQAPPDPTVRHRRTRCGR